MKKIYTCLFLLVFLIGGINAQKEVNITPQLKSNHTVGQTTDVTKDVQANLNESFNFFLPNGWALDPVTPKRWEGNATWAYTQYSSNFGDGSFAVMDCFNIAAGQAGSLITPVLHPVAGNNTLSYEVIEILLNQSYIEPAGMKLYIEFSTNGGTSWTTSTTNVLTGITGHNTATVPQTVTALTASLSAYNGQAVQVRFRCVSDYGGFSLFLDNVTGPEADIAMLTNDIALTDSYLDVAGLSYYAIIPIPQFVGVTLNGEVANLGSASQTNVVYHANDVANGLNLTAPAQTIASAAAGSFVIDLTAPTTYTAYEFGTSVTQTQVDENTANNAGDSIFLEADASWYFRAVELNSYLTPYSFVAGGVPAVTGMEFGGNYHFAADATIDSVSVLIYGANGTGTVVGKIYNIDLGTGDRTVIGQTAPYTPLGTPEWKNIALTTPLDVLAGDIITATVQLNVNIAANDTIKIGADGAFPGDASVAGAAWIQVSGTFDWYYVTGTVPIVGIILNDATNSNVISANGNISVFPNPANDVVFVSENANISVVNMLGQVVASVNNANQINVSALSEGNYIVKVQNDNATSVKKIFIVR